MNAATQSSSPAKSKWMASASARKDEPNSSSFALPPALEHALRDTMARGDAELIVESDAGTASIYAARGAIAWIARGADGEHLARVLERRALADRATLRSVYQDCRRRGRNFAEALIADGVIPRADVHQALLEHNARQLAGVARAEVRATRLVPRFGAYASELVFSLDALVETARRLGEADRNERALPPPTRHVRVVPIRSDVAPAPTKEESPYDMADIKQSLDEVMKIDGAIATALVDWESGLTLGVLGNGSFDIELAASGNTSVVKAKMAVMKQLGIRGGIEDILISLESQYHLIRPLTKASSLFLYVAIDKARGNLGLARHKLKAIEESLSL